MYTLEHDFYITATPIGNYQDITLRALETLRSVDFIVCEKEKEYKKLFGYLDLPIKDYVLCDKKREKEAIELTLELLGEGKKGALISDCGTPLFEDPGYLLISSVRKKFKITALPGANSVITALCLTPFKIDRFYFAGFLPREKKEREKALNGLLKRKEAVIFFETPYRLQNVLELLKKYAYKRKICIPYNLTMSDEYIFAGNADRISAAMKKREINKGEFMIILDGAS